MTIQITRAHERIEIQTLVSVVYGQPGIGKTSLGCTGETPLILDFDNGAHRSKYRADSVQVRDWADLSGLTADDLADYQTIVIDTVGRALDALAAAIIKQNPKMSGYGGGLSLQGYGALKGQFAAWVSLMRSFGKDILFLAHDKESKKGDDTEVRPDVTGGSYGELFKVADAVAYYHVVGKERVLHFSPHSDYVGKNPAQLEDTIVPDFDKHGTTYWAELTAQIKGAIGEISAASQEAAETVSEYRDTVAKIENADQMNATLEAVNDEEPAIKASVKRLMADHCKSIGVVFDKKAGCFVDTEEGTGS